MSSPAKQRTSKCHRCGEPFERKIAATRVERMKYDGAWHDVAVEGVPQRQCDACGITVTADEIRNGRIALELPQKEWAALLGCAAESLSRWESSAILQSRSYDRMLRIFFSVPRARHLLRALDSDKSLGRVAVPGPA